MKDESDNLAKTEFLFFCLGEIGFKPHVSGRILLTLYLLIFIFLICDDPTGGLGGEGHF